MGGGQKIVEEGEGIHRQHMNTNNKQWDEFFKRHGKFFVKPQEDMPGVVKIFKKHKVKRVLDLGCGTGRHAVYFAKNKFDVYGFDIAGAGIKIAKDWLKKKGLKADFKIGSIYQKLPYPDDFFDAVVSINAFHHARIENIRKTIKEMKRILRPGGLIFLNFRKRKFKSWQKGRIVEKYGKQQVRYKVIAPRTYAPIEGWEKDLPHYLFNKKLLKKEFGSFKIDRIWVESDNRHYCLLGEARGNGSRGGYSFDS